MAAETISVSGKEHEVEGKLLLYHRIEHLKYGDRVEIWGGELEKPEEGEEFQWREYLRHKGIYTTTRYPQIKVKANDQGNPILGGLFIACGIMAGEF